MAEFNYAAGIRDFGLGGKEKEPLGHVLKNGNHLHNFLNEPSILSEVVRRFEDHKAGDLNRVLTNTLSSQACCFNLFSPLKQNLKLANNLFSLLLKKKVKVEHIEIEFTPNQVVNLIGFEPNGDESLGDQSTRGGTDADVAIFYKSEDDKKGIIIIEFKYIESEFSTCGSYNSSSEKKKILKKLCNTQNYYQELIKPNLISNKKQFLCGYLKYDNWKLTKRSKIIDHEKVINANTCPFRFSGQQLWRNLLLLEQVMKAREIDEGQFWVLSPSENTYLWNDHGQNVEAEIRSVLSDNGNSLFSRKDIKTDFIENLEKIEANDWTKNWLKKFTDRYLSGTNVN
jgi:hypothetical protein